MLALCFDWFSVRSIEKPDRNVRARSCDMNEATRRLLGVLLRQMDGFASANNRSVVVGATNRRQARSPSCVALPGRIIIREVDTSGGGCRGRHHQPPLGAQHGLRGFTRPHPR